MTALKFRQLVGVSIYVIPLSTHKYQGDLRPKISSFADPGPGPHVCLKRLFISQVLTQFKDTSFMHSQM